MIDIISGMLAKALIPSLTLLTPLVSWGLAEGAKYIRSKVKNDLVDNALTRITHTVETTVADLTQTMVRQLKKEAEDGILSFEDAERIKAVAISTVYDQVPRKIRTLALGGVNDVSDFIEAKIEQAVLKQKSALPPLSRILNVSKGD